MSCQLLNLVLEELQMNSLKQALQLLPYSLKTDPVVVAMYETVAIQLQEAYEDAHALADVKKVDQLPESMLDLIAYEKHVDFYDNQLSIVQKRKLIKSSISWHRKKGTRWAVERVVSIVYPNAKIQEWFEYDGEAYRFKVEVDEPFIASKDMKRLRAMIEATKNKRSWLEYVAIKLPQSKQIELESAHWHYPVYLPVCGTFHCDGLPGKENETTVELNKINYAYPVHLPVTGEIYTNEVMNEW